MDHAHTGRAQPQTDFGRALELEFHYREIQGQFEIEAHQLLTRCTSQGEYEREIDTLHDRMLEGLDLPEEPGLFKGLVVEQGIDNIFDVRITAADGQEVAAERLAAARAAWLRNEQKRTLDRCNGRCKQCSRCDWSRMRRFWGFRGK